MVGLLEPVVFGGAGSSTRPPHAAVEAADATAANSKTTELRMASVVTLFAGSDEGDPAARRRAAVIPARVDCASAHRGSDEDAARRGASHGKPG